LPEETVLGEAFQRRTNARMAASVSCATRSRRPAWPATQGEQFLDVGWIQNEFFKKPALALIAEFPTFSPGGPPNNDAISIALTAPFSFSQA
jgi:hypothetical protein